MDSPTSAPIKGIVLVAGATGGVGKRVVEQLLQQGYKTRALVRDVSKAQQLLGSIAGVSPDAALQLAAGDITQPRTLGPDTTRGVRALIVCTSTKVSPKEGDTPDRQKYMQGIKFYDPEIVGDTPETVELQGVRNLVQACKQSLGRAAGLQVFDAGGKGAARVWGPLDDVVMGGVSESGFEVRQHGAEHGGSVGLFNGIVSSANNGGFASVRTRNFEPELDLGAYDSLNIRLKGNGLRFKAIIRTDTNWDGIGYTLSFDTKQDEWQTVHLPFSQFVPTFRGKTKSDAPALNASNVTSLQLMLSKFEYDGALNPCFKTGAFSLPVQSITAVSAQPGSPRIVHVSSAGTTRPNRPGINKEQEPPAVKLNDELGGLLTYKLAGEDVVRDSGVSYAVVRPCALTEEPAGAELLVDQGDTIKGKISREEIAELCVALLTAPVATDVTFEIKSTVPFSQPFTVSNGAQRAKRDWAALLQAANVKPGVTGKTLNGAYTGREPERQKQRELVAAQLDQNDREGYT